MEMINKMIVNFIFTKNAILNEDVTHNHNNINNNFILLLHLDYLEFNIFYKRKKEKYNASLKTEITRTFSSQASVIKFSTILNATFNKIQGRIF